MTKLVNPAQLLTPLRPTDLSSSPYKQSELLAFDNDFISFGDKEDGNGSEMNEDHSKQSCRRKARGLVTESLIKEAKMTLGDFEDQVPEEPPSV